METRRADFHLATMEHYLPQAVNELLQETRSVRSPAVNNARKASFTQYYVIQNLDRLDLVVSAERTIYLNESFETRESAAVFQSSVFTKTKAVYGAV